MKLDGGERLVLSTLRDLEGRSTKYVDDVHLAAATGMLVEEVRDWLETLDGKGFVERARTIHGISAYITAMGRQALRLAEPIPPAGSAAPNAQRTLLILAANPSNTGRLRLDHEVKQIEGSLERSKLRDQFKLVVKWAVTDDDLRRALLDHKPEIVHFSGHGAGTGEGGSGRDFVTGPENQPGGLAFDDGTGQVKRISGEALAAHFELCADPVKCVVLNACYSGAQAEAIARYVDFVIGMDRAIGDDAAIKFAVGFYDALGAGRGFEQAFRYGCNAIDLKGIPESLTPVLKQKPSPA